MHISHVKKKELRNLKVYFVKWTVRKVTELLCKPVSHWLFVFPAVKGKDESNDIEMTIPGLDWGMEEVMQKDQKKVPQKKVPYAKPIPAQFQQVSW